MVEKGKKNRRLRSPYHSETKEGSFFLMPKFKSMNNSSLAHDTYELQVFKIPQKFLILIRIERIDSENELW